MHKKKIKLILAMFFLLIFGVGGYLYYFPIYPDYKIKDSYFYTKHNDKKFDSEDNGFLYFLKNTSLLSRDENKKAIEYFYYKFKCEEEKDCYDYKKLGDKDKEYKKRIKIVNTLYLNNLEKISNSEYFLSYYFQDGELKDDFGIDYLVYGKFNRIFYNLQDYLYIDNSIVTKNILTYIDAYENMIFNGDNSFIMSVVIFGSLKDAYIYLNNNLELLENISLKSFTFDKDLVDNILKVEYFVFNLYIDTVSKDEDIVNKLFFSKSDTQNLNSKMMKYLIENNGELYSHIKLNGRNYIGRLGFKGYGLRYNKLYEDLDNLSNLRQKLLK